MPAISGEGLDDFYRRSLKSMERQKARVEEKMDSLQAEYMKVRVSNDPNREQQLDQLVEEFNERWHVWFSLKGRIQTVQDRLAGR